MLPDKIGTFEVILAKHIISQERFEQLVQNVFDSSDTQTKPLEWLT
jgi:hypothetical protein